jgi:hypothetical protein
MLTEKLYSPLEFYLHNTREREQGDESNIYDVYDERYKASYLEGVQCKEQIRSAIRSESSWLNRTKGLAVLPDGPLANKVISIFPAVEEYVDHLAFVAEVSLSEPLTSGEMSELKVWWSSQLSDGWGEKLKQREIWVGETELLYVVPWTSGNDFYIDTQAEFYERMSQVYANLEHDETTTELAEQTLLKAKLYSPVFVDFWEYDSDGEDGEGISQAINQWGAAQHYSEIRTAIVDERLPGEAERGLMAYYDEPDSVKEKVRSLILDVEIHDGMLWAVASLELTEPLTANELKTLKDYITGQFSDGWGEGFEQRAIKVDGGELSVHLWKSDSLFEIVTQEQFSERLGVRLPADALSQLAPEVVPLTPAEKALDEPDMHNSEEVVALREQLINRINNNLTDYFNTLNNSEGKGIIDASHEVSAMTGAHYYLCLMHNFHPSELKYLLQFKDPLKVVAYEFQWNVVTEYHPDIMWDVFHKQEALRGNHELVTEADSPSYEQLYVQLRGRLTDNFAVYKRDWLELSKEELVDIAAEVASVKYAFEYFMEDYSYSDSDIAFLLKFENPLEFISEKWDNGLPALGQALENIFGNQEITLESGFYPLVPSETFTKTAPITPAVQTSALKERDTGEKPSVLEEIRQAKKAAQENSAQSKGPMVRKKIEPDSRGGNYELF